MELFYPRWLSRRPKGLRHLAERVISRSQKLHSLDDQALNLQSIALQHQVRSGTPLSQLLIAAFALVREASQRIHRMSPFEVQIMAGVALSRGELVEMQTGEGKTLAAILPMFLHSLTGRGVHVVTANDYLAQRDSEFATPIFRMLGLTVGCIHSSLEHTSRRPEYSCDVTYGTAREFGFDFLRDRLEKTRENDDGVGLLARESRRENILQRGQHYAIVDEADSILIDDARTPLLIANEDRDPGWTSDLYAWSSTLAADLVPESDYRLDQRRRNAHLTVAGCRRVLTGSFPDRMKSIPMDAVYRQVEKALVAQLLLSRDRDYVVVDGTVSIVDESTGRIAEGRKWQEGLHQAVEAKESVASSSVSRPAARITVQSYFRRYRLLSGLTGTAQSARREFRNIYGLRLTCIPTRRVCERLGLLPRVFVSRERKYDAIAEDVTRYLQNGRAILVGTPSVECSQNLSRVLLKWGVAHQLLNCKQNADEAHVIARAGLAGQVTIATNMAGRGTDIVVAPPVLDAGGLHVIATEMHSNSRIDRQLIGRTARQGEPGSFQFFLSLDDELLKSSPQVVQRVRSKVSPQGNGEIAGKWHRVFTLLQTKLQKRHQHERRQMMKQERARNQLFQDMGLDSIIEAIE